MHAAIDFTFEHPEIAADWHTESNTIVFLAVPDEQALGLVCDRLAAYGVTTTEFYEPDLGGALTAVCCEPAGSKHLTDLPLALYQPRGGE